MKSVEWNLWCLGLDNRYVPFESDMHMFDWNLSPEETRILHASHAWWFKELNHLTRWNTWVVCVCVCACAHLGSGMLKLTSCVPKSFLIFRLRLPLSRCQHQYPCHQKPSRTTGNTYSTCFTCMVLRRVEPSQCYSTWLQQLVVDNRFRFFFMSASVQNKYRPPSETPLCFLCNILLERFMCISHTAYHSFASCTLHTSWIAHSKSFMEELHFTMQRSRRENVCGVCSTVS